MKMDWKFEYCRTIISNNHCFLRERLDPITIMSYIDLPQPEREQIIQRTTNKGNQRGVDELLDTIKCRCPTAFYELMNGLNRNHPEAYKTIYNDFIDNEYIKEQINSYTTDTTRVERQTVSNQSTSSQKVEGKEAETLDSLKESVWEKIAEALNKDENWRKLLKKLDLKRKEAVKIREAENPGETLLITINENITIKKFDSYLKEAELQTVRDVFKTSDDLPSKGEQSISVDLTNENPVTTTTTCAENRTTGESSLEENEPKKSTSTSPIEGTENPPSSSSVSVIGQCTEDVRDSSETSPSADGSDVESETQEHSHLSDEEATNQQDAPVCDSLASNRTVNLDNDGAGHSISVAENVNQSERN